MKSGALSKHARVLGEVLLLSGGIVISFERKLRSDHVLLYYCHLINLQLPRTPNLLVHRPGSYRAHHCGRGLNFDN
jgi:hypothetical protein